MDEEQALPANDPGLCDGFAVQRVHQRLMGELELCDDEPAAKLETNELAGIDHGQTLSASAEYLQRICVESSRRLANPDGRDCSPSSGQRPTLRVLLTDWLFH